MKVLWPLFVVLLFACSKEEPKWAKEELMKMALKSDSTASLILPRSIADAIPCSDYGEGCMSVHKVKVKNLEMIAVEFIDAASAQAAARKIRGWTTRNWLLDDVQGEPVLEAFCAQVFEAGPITGKASGDVKTPVENAPPSQAIEQ